MSSSKQDAELMHVVQHQPFYPFTMFWPTDDVFNRLPEDRKTWLYSEDHRDKLQAYLKAHIVRDQRVNETQTSMNSVKWFKTFNEIKLYIKVPWCYHLIASLYHGTAIVLSFKGHKTVLVVCFQVVAVALTAERSLETLIGSELRFSCNKVLTVSIWMRNNEQRIQNIRIGTKYLLLEIWIHICLFNFSLWNI